MRPAIQTITRKSSGSPCNGSLPVQFGIAVSRNPVTTAARSQRAFHAGASRAAQTAWEAQLRPRRAAATAPWRVPPDMRQERKRDGSRRKEEQGLDAV